MSSSPTDTGVVVIARNEGERLRRSLESVLAEADTVVYADSASTDGSVDLARSLGASVVELDPRGLLNAPRGRNAGFRHLLEVRPDARYVLFLDGDCQLVPGWLEAAREELERDPGLAAVCGRRVEVQPEASVYNRVVDAEWNTPVGETCACGGDVLIRVEALLRIRGYDEAMSCGEDPEMCFRLREKGWRLLRMPGDMTRHDVALLRFSQWWRRHARGGYAYAHGAFLHLHGPEWFNLGRCANILAWGLFLPLLVLGLAPFVGGWSLVGLALYGVLWARVRAWRAKQGDDPREASIYSLFVVLGKLAEAQGILTFLAHRVFGRRSLYVEYKDYQLEEGRASVAPVAPGGAHGDGAAGDPDGQRGR